jgi:hypothetical protein
MRAFARVVTASAVLVGSWIALAPAASAADTQQQAALPYPVMCFEILPDIVNGPEICIPWPI